MHLFIGFMNPQILCHCGIFLNHEFSKILLATARNATLKTRLNRAGAECRIAMEGEKIR